MHTSMATFLAIGSLLAASCAPRSEPVAVTTTALMDVDIIPMDRDRILRNQVVEMRGGEITYLGPVQTYRPPSGAKLERPCGRFVMPGLADMHMHIEPSSFNSALLRGYLDHGVTTIRSLSGDPGLLRLRKQIDDGLIDGPRLWVSGPIILGRPSATLSARQQITVGNPQEARTAVAEQVRAGYDLIKLYEGLDKASYLAAIDEAQRLNAYVVGHLPDEIPLEAALSSGIDEIAHADEFLSYHWKDYDPAKVNWQHQLDFEIDMKAIPATASRLKQHGQTIVANLVADETVYRGIADPDRLLRGPEYSTVPLETLAKWRTSGRFLKWRGQDAYRRDRIQPFLTELVRALDKADVPLLAGSDLGVEGIVPGYGLWRELEILEDAGLSPYRALATATRNAALAASRMGKPMNWGIVAPGHRADLVVLQSNPLETAYNLRSLCQVFKAGQPRVEK